MRSTPLILPSAEIRSWAWVRITAGKKVDLHGKYVCPGLIDGHIHIESSMLCGPAFEQAVLPHGTTAVVTDPHEISNVAGLEGLDFMLETTKKF